MGGSRVLTPARAPPPRRVLLSWLQDNPPEVPDPQAGFGPLIMGPATRKPRNNTKNTKNGGVPSPMRSQVEPAAASSGNPLRWAWSLTGAPGRPSASTASSDSGGSGSAWKARAKLNQRNQHLTQLSLELLCRTRGDLLPDPAHDPVVCVAFVVRDDDVQEAMGSAYVDRRGLLVVDDPAILPGSRFTSEAAAASGGGGDGGPVDGRDVMCWWRRTLGLGPQVELQVFASEMELLEGVGKLVTAIDPDIVMGWEIQQSSLGYLVERGQALRLNMSDM